MSCWFYTISGIGMSMSAWEMTLINLNINKLSELEEVLKSKLSEQSEPIWPSLLDWPIFIDKTLNEKKHINDEYIYWSN